MLATRFRNPYIVLEDHTNSLCPISTNYISRPCFFNRLITVLNSTIKVLIVHRDQFLAAGNLSPLICFIRSSCCRPCLATLHQLFCTVHRLSPCGIGIFVTISAFSGCPFNYYRLKYYFCFPSFNSWLA